MSTHKPQRNSPERVTELHIRRNRQALRDARRGLLWQRSIGLLLDERNEAIGTDDIEKLKTLPTPSQWARRFARFGFMPVPKTGWRAKARAEAAKEKAAA
jgi:hypothetical protein